MNVVIKVNNETKEKMIEYYKDKCREKTPPYAIFQAMEEDTVITLYNSGKAMFQGPTAFVDANMWQELSGVTKDDKKEKEKLEKYYYASCVGSDEVGTGDYFGPIVVTASYLKKEDIEKLEKLGVHDSKKLTDEKILKIMICDNNQLVFKSILKKIKEITDIEILDVSHMSRKLIKQGTEEIALEYFYTEITSKNVDKWNALEMLIEMLNITKDEVITIGDNANDVKMIQNAGLGVAMGESAP